MKYFFKSWKILSFLQFSWWWLKILRNSGVKKIVYGSYIWKMCAPNCTPFCRIYPNQQWFNSLSLQERVTHRRKNGTATIKMNRSGHNIKYRTKNSFWDFRSLMNLSYSFFRCWSNYSCPSSFPVDWFQLKSVGNKEI